MAVELFAKVGEGKALIPERAYLDKLKDFSMGELIKVSVRRPRKNRPHNFMFRVIELAYDTWPEDHKFTPQNPEHLRAYLLIHAGHFSIFAESVRRLGNPKAMVEFMAAAMNRTRQAGGYSFVVEQHQSIAVYIPHSISFHKMDEDEIRPIREAIFDIIVAETGQPIELFKSEAFQQTKSGKGNCHAISQH